MNTYKTSSRRYSKRASLEFYPTPPEAVRALLSVETFEGSVWEPACGYGDISKVFLDAGHKVISTDLAHRNFGRGGVDFLKTTKPLAKNIITNPPYGRYGLGDAFVRKALIHVKKTGGAVAMLLNLRSLCNPKRHKKFLKTPPSAIYLLDELTCWPYGIKGSFSSRIAKQQYCWVLWKPNHTGQTKLGWLSPREFKM